MEEQFLEKAEKVRGKQSIRTCFLVRAQGSELRELKRRNETLWRMLWTTRDYARKNMRPTGKLVWTSPNMSVAETLNAFAAWFPES